MRQATINIGTIGHVAHGKSTVVKAISGVQTVRFKNELERNITIKLGYANAKVVITTGRKLGPSRRSSDFEIWIRRMEAKSSLGSNDAKRCLGSYSANRRCIATEICARECTCNCVGSKGRLGDLFQRKKQPKEREDLLLRCQRTAPVFLLQTPSHVKSPKLIAFFPFSFSTSLALGFILRSSNATTRNARDRAATNLLARMCLMDGIARDSTAVGK